MGIGVYVHIPFCARKCPYCDFYSLPAPDSLKERYTSSLIKSLSVYNKGIYADTVYFGGGTPLLIGADRLGEILSAVKSHFKITPNAEITVEANPNSIDEKDLYKLYKYGFNRISFGVQSANRNELDILKRTHTVSQVRSAILSARNAGFKNISADIMLGTPNQTKADVRRTAEFVMSLGVEHISAYMLKIEPNTEFNCKEIISSLPDDDEVSDIYLMLCEMLEQNGYGQYEISNFAKKGFESRHNLKYWHCEEYLGFGPGAHSFFEGKRFFYERDINGYIASFGKNITVDGQSVDALEEYIMLGLRLNEGISLTEAKRLGADTDDILKRCKIYIDNGFMTKNKGRLALTRKGFLVSNTVIASLV